MLYSDSVYVCMCVPVCRSIIWLQRRRDEILERLRGSAHQQHRDDLHELQIGRLKQDRVHIPRGGDVSPKWNAQNIVVA